MRQVSTTALQAMLAQQTDQIFLTCVKISHGSLSSDLRFVNDTQNLSRSDGTYMAAAFEFRLPTDQEDNVPRGQIVLDNTDRQIIQAVRPLNEAPDIEVSIVLRSSPNTIEVGPMSFKLKEFRYDESTISGSLGYEEEFLNASFPKSTFNPRSTPGVF